MAYRTQWNQHQPSESKSFTRLLAQYRACVYETHFLATSNPIDLMNSMDIATNPSEATILVIEDNPDQWFLTRWALWKRFAEARIQWLTQADEVLPYLDTCQRQELALPRLILVDLYLPRVEQGLGVFQALKSHPIYKPVPTVALSGSDSSEDIVQVLSHSADGYIVKPSGYDNWVAGLSVLDSYWNR